MNQHTPFGPQNSAPLPKEDTSEPHPYFTHKLYPQTQNHTLASRPLPLLGGSGSNQNNLFKTCYFSACCTGSAILPAWNSLLLLRLDILYI